jgi:hypothetical protein
LRGLSHHERSAMLRIFDKLVSRIPKRSTAR